MSSNKFEEDLKKLIPEILIPVRTEKRLDHDSFDLLIKLLSELGETDEVLM